MKLFRLLLPLAATICVLADSGIAQNTISADTDIVKIVATGEIRKIDSKKQTFEVKLTFENGPANSGNIQAPTRSSGPTIGTGRRGGMGGGRRGGGYPQTVQRRPATTTLNVKVFASDKTLLKDGDTSIGFPSLKNGEHVTFTGVHKGTGNDVDALEISRTTSGG